MKKEKQKAGIPLSFLFDNTPYKRAGNGKTGVIVELADTPLKRLRFELSLPTMTPEIKRAIEDEMDRGLSEWATRKENASIQNAINGSRRTKSKLHVTKEALESFRLEFMLKQQFEKGWPEDKDHGWKTKAADEFHLDRKTIRERLKK